MPEPIQTPVVEPIAQTQSAPQVEPQTPPPPEQPEQPEPPETDLPPEVINIPAIQAVLAGSPPAVSMRIKGSEDRDDVALLAENKDPLLAAGMNFYKSMSGELGVMFNALKINLGDIQAADKAGKLTQIAPDFDSVNQEVGKATENHPVLMAARNPTPAAPAASVAAQTPPQAASGQLPLVPPAPASVARKLAAQRILNLQAGAPTSGAAPGGGRLLNSVLKSVV